MGDIYHWPNRIVPPIHYANSQWAVTNYGLECLTAYYPIERARLTETRPGGGQKSDWVMHLAEKEWCDIDELVDALRKAVEIHRVRGRSAVDFETARYEAKKQREEDARFSAFCREVGLNSPYTLNDLKAATELYQELDTRAPAR